MPVHNDLVDLVYDEPTDEKRAYIEAVIDIIRFGRGVRIWDDDTADLNAADSDLEEAFNTL